MATQCQVSPVAGALFSLNAHCGTVFSILDKNDKHLMGQSCPLCLLQVEPRLIRPYDAGHFI
jgi:hypothetical protein